MAKKKPATPKTIDTTRLTLAGVDARLERLEQRVERIRQDIEQNYDDSINSFVGLRNALALLAMIVFLATAVPYALSARGCKATPEPQPAPQPEPSPGPAPEPQPQPKTLTGTVVFVHPRDPLSKLDAELLIECDKLKSLSSGFDWRSVDSDHDKSEPVQKIIAEAAKKGIKPPLMMHKSSDGSVRFAAMVTTLDDVIKEFGK